MGERERNDIPSVERERGEEEDRESGKKPHSTYKLPQVTATMSGSISLAVSITMSYAAKKIEMICFLLIECTLNISDILIAYLDLCVLVTWYSLLQLVKVFQTLKVFQHEQ